MRRRLIAAGVLAISLGGIAQEDAPKPRVSDAPLTSEQIAVYQAVLAVYLKGSDGILNLANITEPLDEADGSCLRGFDAGIMKESATVIHRIGPSLTTGRKIALVDPDHQKVTIRENDPQNRMRKAIDEGQQIQQITDKQLGQSIKTAFESGLFTLSEIVFDKEHRHAAVSYSFVCGGLCGNGNTLVLKKVGQSWKVAKRCGGWVS